jgi:hypothetical protein
MSRWLPAVRNDLPRIQTTQGVGLAWGRIIPNGLNFKWDKSLCFVKPPEPMGATGTTFSSLIPLSVQF